MRITNRHGRLIEFLQSGEFSSPSLAKNLKVSEQTIYRDIESLRQRGYRIEAVRNAKGWAYKLRSQKIVAVWSGAANQ